MLARLQKCGPQLIVALGVIIGFACMPDEPPPLGPAIGEPMQLHSRAEVERRFREWLCPGGLGNAIGAIESQSMSEYSKEEVRTYWRLTAGYREQAVFTATEPLLEFRSESSAAVALRTRLMESGDC